MKRKLLVSIILSVLLLTGCGNTSGAGKFNPTAGDFQLPLSPVPLSMKVNASIVPHLEVATAKGTFAKQATKDGALAQAVVYYLPISGKKIIYMSVFEFPTKAFDRLKNPNQPPSYGQEVLRVNGDVFSVAGPSDSIFDPKSQDGILIAALYATIYKTVTYSATP